MVFVLLWEWLLTDLKFCFTERSAENRVFPHSDRFFVSLCCQRRCCMSLQQSITEVSISARSGHDKTDLATRFQEGLDTRSEEFVGMPHRQLPLRDVWTSVKAQGCGMAISPGSSPCQRGSVNSPARALRNHQALKRGSYTAGIVGIPWTPWGRKPLGLAGGTLCFPLFYCTPSDTMCKKGQDIM